MGKVFAVQAQRPEFRSPEPTERLGLAVPIWNSLLRGAETGESQGLSDQSV